MPIRTAKTYFYPRSPCGERPIKRERGYYSYTFLSTLSLRRATRAWPNIGPAKWISIHALLAESDLYQHGRPARRVISIHALLAESDFTVKVGRSNRNISIHALLAESDANANFMVERVSYFYPRSPCGERRNFWNESSVLRLFLSTLSLRRATYWATRARAAQLFLSTLSLRRATICDLKTAKKGITFLSTLSLRRATGRVLQDITPAGISIHALLAESDRPGITRYYPGRNFYPRSPCGERPLSIGIPQGAFQISIHALLAESDQGYH